MIPFAVLLAAATTQSSAQGANPNTVVVSAKGLETTRQALQACIARSCPPKDDINASLAHAENLFVAGDYKEAQRILAKSRKRNDRFASDLPVEVADLRRAYGRMASVYSQPKVGRLAQTGSLDALRSGLKPDDPRVLAQQIMVADEFVRGGRLAASDDMYRSIEKRARRANHLDLVGTVLFKQATIYSALASVNPMYRKEAERRIRRVETTTEPQLAAYRDATTVLRAKLAALQGDTAALETAIARIDPKNYPQPILLYEPSLSLDTNNDDASKLVRNEGDEAPQWIDVTFDISRNGRVENAAVIQSSEAVNGSWPSRILNAVRLRRYTPVAADVDETLLRRSERFSMVFNQYLPNGSKWIVAAKVGEVISMDMTLPPIKQTTVNSR